MKKIMLLAIVAVIGLGSCKRDEEVKPQSSKEVSKSNELNKKDMGVWD